MLWPNSLSPSLELRHDEAVGRQRMPFKIKFKKIIILGPTPYNHYNTPIITLEIGVSVKSCTGFLISAWP
jgi:hypothetical protein